MCFLRPLVAGALLSLSTLGAVAAPPPLAEVETSLRQGEDWPRFLGPTADGKSTETGFDFAWPEEGPPLLWWHALGEGYSMPSTAGHRLFVLDRLEDRVRLTCLDNRSGEMLWQQSYDTAYEDLYGYSNGPRASPLIDGERVYTYGAAGRLRCHRVSDGAVLWDVDSLDMFGVVQNFFGVGGSPVIEGDLLIVQVGGSPANSPPIHSGKVRGNGSAVVAFDKLSGEVRYRLGDELASYTTPVLATIDGRRRGFVFTRGGLLGFDPQQGKQEFFFPWRAKKLESVNASTPVVVDDMVFLSESYGPGSALLKVKPEGYEVIWQDGRRDQAMASHWTTPIHHRGYLYGCSGQSSGEAELRCIDLRTGTVQWSRPGLRRSTLLYADEHLIVLTESGQLLVIEATPEAFRQVAGVDLGEPEVRTSNRSAKGVSRPSTGAKPRLRFPAWNAPILSRGILYVRGKDQLLAFDLRSPAGGAQGSEVDSSKGTASEETP